MTDMLTASRDEYGLSDLMARRPSQEPRRIAPDVEPKPYRRGRSRGRQAISCGLRECGLRETVERDVVPRVHAALQKNLQGPLHPLINSVAAIREDVSDFAECMLGGTFESARDRVDAMRAAGRSLEHIYLKLLAPTACHLRELWSNDFCGFADMTFALCTLQSVLRWYAQDFYAETSTPDCGSRVLVVTPSTDGIDLITPMFGLMLTSQFFRRGGWEASIERDLTCGRFRETVGEWFDMVEVLAVGDMQLDEIASGIRTIRRGSPNPSIGVIVCGQIFSDRPDYIGLVGADLMASDPLSSLSQAQSFLTRQTQQRRLV